MARRSVVILALSVLAIPHAFAGDWPVGPGKVPWESGSKKLDLFVHRPKSFDPKTGRILFVFHGINRNAEEYRDWAIPLAEATGGLLVVPHFDKEAFPTTAYQQGNVMKGGKIMPREQWTWSLLPRIANEIRQQIGRADMPFDFVGHSAGGQFVGRSAAFLETGATRLVAANSGTYLFPTRDQTYPLGFGGLPDEFSNDAAIKAYLARPLTLFLGTGDTVADKNFDVTEAAMKQGGSRYERGKNFLAAGQKLATERGWPCAWRIVEAENVGHVAKTMFSHPNATVALRDKIK
jgi:poly(3-hydroxybutyrate) depolymerase